MSLETDIRQLGLVPIFARLDYEARRLLAFSAETRILRAGDVLFRKGERADCGYFVVHGAIVLDHSSDHVRAVQIIGPSGLIGEMALLIETERPAMAVAREPSTVLKISRTLFHRVLQEYPQAANLIRGAIAERLAGFVTELQRLKT